MKQAIVWGATGFVGSGLIKTLIQHNISVLAIGRREYKNTQLSKYPLDYIRINTTQDNPFEENYSTIHNLIKTDDLVFFNVAWSGQNRLTDGDLSDQIKNLFTSSQALIFSHKIGCKKFINIGTQDEALFSQYITNGGWKESLYSTNSSLYACTKHATKDITRLLAYLEKIDHINTRFSIALDSQLSGVSFVAQMLKKIKNNEQYELPRNKNLCEIISLDELGEALYHVGLKGKNKADYYLGMGTPHTLEEYFSYFSKVKSSDVAFFAKEEESEAFNPSSLISDTGFQFQKNFSLITKDILNQ